MNPSPLDALTEADYRRALELWQPELLKSVRNASIQPHWIGGTDRFWIRREGVIGHRFVLIDAASGQETLAFDHEVVGRALGAPPDALPLQEFEFVEGERAIHASTPGGVLRIDLASGEKRPVVGAPDQSVLVAPTGRSVFVRDFNLWLRETDGAERPLTTDGTPFHAWSSLPDHDLMKVARTRTALPMPVFGCFWAPNSRHLLAQRADERALEPYPYLESVPVDGSPRPKVHWIRQQLAGEPGARHQEWFVWDADSGSRVEVQRPAGADRLKIVADTTGGAYWSDDSRRAYVLAASSNSDRVALYEIEAATGACRIVHEETVGTFFDSIRWNTRHRMSGCWMHAAECYGTRNAPATGICTCSISTVAGSHAP